jgi:hypothetical protein
LGVAAYVADDSSIAANIETKDPIENLRMLFSTFFMIYIDQDSEGPANRHKRGDVLQRMRHLY